MSVSRWITDSRGAGTGARGFAEHDGPTEPTEPAEMGDAEYERLFAARFGPSYIPELPAAADLGVMRPTAILPTSGEFDLARDPHEDDGYAVEFERRFGFEATR